MKCSVLYLQNSTVYLQSFFLMIPPFPVHCSSSCFVDEWVQSRFGMAETLHTFRYRTSLGSGPFADQVTYSHSRVLVK